MAENEMKGSAPADNYAFHPFRLTFVRPETEVLYRNQLLDRTMWFCRIAWGSVILLSAIFAVLDLVVFQDQAGSVMIMRTGVMLWALGLFAASSLGRIGASLEFQTNGERGWLRRT